MNMESNRLGTFTNWPSSAPVDPVRIAKAGFFYTGQNYEVECFSCGCKISEWNYGDLVMWRHRTMEPNCAFVVNPDLSGNVPTALACDYSTSQSPRSSTGSDEDIGHPRTDEDDMYKNHVLRLLSFVNWEDTSVSRETLVSAGFYHMGGGRLRCAWCSGELAPFRNLGSLGPLLDVHRMYFPHCPFVVSKDSERQNADTAASSLPNAPPLQRPCVNNANKSQLSGAQHNEQVVAAGGAWRELGVVGGKPRHPLKASLATRLDTYYQWPSNRSQTPRALSEAGFFYTGVDDQVRCYYCDGGLGRWEQGDAPWSEHARWFPGCGYVLLVKGQEFIDLCKNLSSEHKNADERYAIRKMMKAYNNYFGDVEIFASSSASFRQNILKIILKLEQTISADGGPSGISQNLTVNNAYSESQVEECMGGSAATAALAAGLDAARVRRAVARRLRTTGLPFGSPESLIDAVLDEQLNEEAWSETPHSSRLTRDILAETLLEFLPCRSNSSNANHRLDNQSSQSSPLRNSPSRNMSDNKTTRPDKKNKKNLKKIESTTDNVVETIVEKKQLTLEEENRQLKEARLCKVCMDNEVSVVFLPCGHLVACAGCGAALTACPLCRGTVRALVRAYLA